MYLAKTKGHAAFEKWVAVKVIAPQLATDRSFVRMFLDEARLVARLNHPNICAVLDFGEADATYFLTMEYLHGESLSTLIKSMLAKGSPLPVAVACRIVADAARGLHAAHELKLNDGTLANVVHRDVSPQNIFVLYDGVTKVVDFGIARSVDRTAERTSTGMIKGKLAYMAPEQLRGLEPDRRVDVFALGVVLWECITGKRLFQRNVEAATMCAVLQDPIPAPSSAAPGIARELDAIIARALCRNPDERIASAGEFARELDRFVASMGVPIGPDEVGDLMKRHFADRMAQRDKLLHADLSPSPAREREEQAAVAVAFGSRDTIAPPRDDEEIDELEAADEPESRSAVGRRPQHTDANFTAGSAAFSSTGTPSMPIQDAPTGMAVPAQQNASVAAPPRTGPNRALLVVLAIALPLLGVGVGVVLSRGSREPQPSVVIVQGTSTAPAQPAPLTQPAQPTATVPTPAPNAALTADAATQLAAAQPAQTTEPAQPAQAQPTRSRTHTNSSSGSGSQRASGNGSSANGTTNASSGARPSGVRAATNFETL